ncbi:PAC2 family protein [Chloroflexota bacterium]
MDAPDGVRITERPKLKHPHMFCGISGWVDGGESATGSIQYLIEKLEARKFAEMSISKFSVFQVPGQNSVGPSIKIEEGILKEHSFPHNEFFYWVNPNADSDLILFLGTEPNIDWDGYARAILNVASEFEVTRMYLLGGILDKTPHTREPNVTCTCSSYEIRDEMQKYGVQFSNYEGPGSFGTTLVHMCQNEDFEATTITARATYYPEFNILIPHNPKSIRAVVKRINSLTRLNVDLSDLDRQAEEFEGKLGFMIGQNSEFRAYVENLENEYTEVNYEEPLDLSAHEAVKLAEELLRENER